MLACSLELEGSQAAKRRRTRHQHFWRNTDKLDPDERVYVPTSCIKPAIKKKRPVMSKSEISPEERTNAWTVCLTTRGVIGYLNKRISPLGKQLLGTAAVLTLSLLLCMQRSPVLSRVRPPILSSVVQWQQADAERCGQV